MSKTRNIAVCLVCGTILESIHHHDYQVCPCPQHTSVDGGTDYVRGGGQDLNKAKWVSSMEEAKAIHAANGPYLPTKAPKKLRGKWHLGCFKAPGSTAIEYALFQTRITDPQVLQDLLSSLYFAIVGPFKSKRGAQYMQVNPDCETVWDAERLARCQQKPTTTKGA